jgi:hypothetical protein
VNRCGVPASTPHSSVFVRLASGAFYETIGLVTFYEIIKIVILIGILDVILDRFFSRVNK